MKHKKVRHINKNEIYLDKNIKASHNSALPEARSKISGRNVYKISGQFQDIFVGFTRLKTQKVHIFSVLINVIH